MTAATEMTRAESRRRMQRARFYVCLVAQGAAYVVGWPLDEDAAKVALYVSLLRSGIEPEAARDAIEVAPLTDAWPPTTFTNGRTCFTAKDVREGLDYGDDGPVPDALDFLLAMGGRS